MTPAHIALVVALGDSITYGYGIRSPATQNYAAVYARRIGARLVDLAEPGYTCADVFKREVPKLPAAATIVILNCGTNDIGGFTRSRIGGRRRVAPATAVRLRASMASFNEVLAAVRKREVHAKIFLVNVRHWQRMTGPEDPAFFRDVANWNAMLASTGLTVVNVAANPRMYDPGYIQYDLLHPNVAGSRVIASLIP